MNTYKKDMNNFISCIKLICILSISALPVIVSKDFKYLLNSSKKVLKFPLD